MNPVRILRALLSPLTFLLRVLAYPLRLRARRRLLKGDGWAELWVEGEVMELRPVERWAQDVLRRILRRSEGPRVVLSRLRRFTDAFIADPHARGVLVRLGPLGGGWAAADEIRRQLLRVQRAGRQVVVFMDPGAGNREVLVASAATRLCMPPSAGLAATGTAAPGLFLKDTLAKLGVTMEVAAAGRFKSAPDQFVRADRSAFDREQTEAIVRALDHALVDGLIEGGRFDADSAQALLTASPVVGTSAKAQGFVQSLVREEELGDEIQAVGELEGAPKLLGAGTYVDAHALRSPFARRRRRVGIVEVHGGIVDQAPGFGGGGERMAVRRAVVDDVRAALADKSIGAVVLHVNSRGGSVTASDGIFAAVRRLNLEKPVIACFGDVAASGGYYVACGARAIVASPLTITGSIGVFAMIPTWPELGRRLAVGHDVIRQYANAGLYDPWSGLDDRARAHARQEVEAMYQDFIGLVAEARGRSKDEIHAVAEGRVWMGADAKAQGLVDGLGGVEEAVARAKEEAGGAFEAEPVLVRALRPRPRPDPYKPDAKSQVGLRGFAGLGGDAGVPPQEHLPALLRLVAQGEGGAVLLELAALALTSPGPLRAAAYLPWVG
jgi:protease-4